MATLLEITETNFEAEVEKSKLPVLIDFWAVWCGPCKIIAPVVEELALEYTSKFKVAKCNVDENQALAAKFGIRSIPTLLIFKEGKITQQIIGAVPKQTIKAKIDEVLAS